MIGLKQDRERIPWGWRFLNPLGHRSCSGYTQTQELSSLPSHILCLRMLQGDSWTPRGDVRPRRMVKFKPNSWLNPWSQIHCLSPNEDPWWTLRSEHASCPAPSAHDSVRCCVFAWDFLVVRWPPWMTFQSLLDSNWLRTQDILNHCPHSCTENSHHLQLTKPGRGIWPSLAGERISRAGGVWGLNEWSLWAPAPHWRKPGLRPGWGRAVAELVLSGHHLCPVRSPRSRLCCIHYSLYSESTHWCYATVPSMEWLGGTCLPLPVVWPEVNSDVSEPRLGMVNRPSWPHMIFFKGPCLNPLWSFSLG